MPRLSMRRGFLAGPGRMRHHRRCDAYPAGSRRVPGEEEPAGSVCPGQNLPWRNIPAGRTQHDRGHGREEHRILQVTAVAAGIAFPHAAQAIRVTRRIRPLSGQKKWRTVTVYAITSLDAAQAAPGQLAQWIRGHWQIELLHHIRDVSYGEDASQIRTGSGPQAMAALRNLGIGILKMAGHARIAAACATTPATPPGPWQPSDSTRHDRNGHNATMPRPRTMSASARSLSTTARRWGRSPHRSSAVLNRSANTAPITSLARRPESPPFTGSSPWRAVFAAAAQAPLTAIADVVEMTG